MMVPSVVHADQKKQRPLDPDATPQDAAELGGGQEALAAREARHSRFCHADRRLAFRDRPRDGG